MVDFGLLAESLVFYDQVYLAAPRAEAFVALCKRVAADGDLEDFIALLRNGEIVIVDYDFHTSILVSGPGSTAGKAMHLRDPVTNAGNVFQHYSLGAPDLQSLLSGSQRVKLGRAALKHIFLVRQGQNDTLTRDATADYRDIASLSAIFSALAGALGLAIPATPLVQRVDVDQSGFVKVVWNFNFSKFSSYAQAKLGTAESVMQPLVPLGLAIQRNRLLWSAGIVNADLHLSRPFDDLVAGKLRQRFGATKSVTDVITPIVNGAEFPDIRGNANDGLVSLRDAIRFRAKAKRFRKWLHEERTHDRDAVASYLGQFSQDSALSTMTRRLLTVAAPIAGAVVGATVTGPDNSVQGAATGAAAGGLTERLIDALASKVGQWKPVVFGSWLKSRLDRLG